MREERQLARPAAGEARLSRRHEKALKREAGKGDGKGEQGPKGGQAKQSVSSPTMAIPRELFPLPLPRLDHGVADHCSRSVRSRRRREEATERWLHDTIRSLNSLFGRGEGQAVELAPSAAQLAGVKHLHSTLRESGPPTTTAAAAHGELCGMRAGYMVDPSTHRPYQRGLVSLPTLGATAAGEEILQGNSEALDFWKIGRASSCVLWRNAGSRSSRTRIQL